MNMFRYKNTKELDLKELIDCLISHFQGSKTVAEEEVKKVQEKLKLDFSGKVEC